MFSCGGFLAALATVESGFHGCINRWSCRNCGWSLMQSPRATTVSRKRRGMPHNASRSDAKKHERPLPCLSRSFSSHSKRDLLNRQTTVKGEYCRVIVLVATDWQHICWYEGSHPMGEAPLGSLRGISNVRNSKSLPKL